jgi:hypothetical protein
LTFSLKLWCVRFLSHWCYMLPPPYLPCLGSLCIWRTVQFFELLITQFPPASYYFILGDQAPSFQTTWHFSFWISETELHIRQTNLQFFQNLTDTINLISSRSLTYIHWHPQIIKITPWSESASELHRPSDRRLSAKRLPTFCVVSVTDPYGRIFDFLVKVTLRPIIRRPVRLGVRRPSGTRDQFFYLLKIFF